MYEQGGRSFWIHNTGPLGCLAYVLYPFTKDQLDQVGCAIPLNELAQDYNERLNQTVVQLRKDLPLAAFTYVDVYSAKYNLFKQPEKYGKVILLHFLFSLMILSFIFFTMKQQVNC